MIPTSLRIISAFALALKMQKSFSMRRIAENGRVATAANNFPLFATEVSLTYGLCALDLKCENFLIAIVRHIS